jgi:hypothetical protein
MRIARPGLVAALVVGLASPSFGGDLRESVAKAAQQQQTPAPQSASGGSKALMWTGGLMFAGGMVVGLFGFIDNQNGEFTEFGEKGEANAVNKALGAAGLSAAFAGGLLMYAGSHRAQRLPTVVIGRDRVRLVKRFAW